MRLKMFHIYLVWAMQKGMVSMATHNAVFKNGDVRTKLLIFHLLRTYYRLLNLASN